MLQALFHYLLVFGYRFVRLQMLQLHFDWLLMFQAQQHYQHNQQYLTLQM